LTHRQLSNAYRSADHGDPQGITATNSSSRPFSDIGDPLIELTTEML
jgi:hypothetical protein